MDLFRQSPMFGSFYAPVLALHAAATTLDSTNAFHFAINGLLYTKAALSTAATPTTDANTAVAFNRVGTSTGCLFLILLNAAGTIAVAQGPIVALDASGSFVLDPQLPPVPDAMCPVGYVVCKAGATAAAVATGWLFGTSNFSGVTGITLSVHDLCSLPGRLVAS